jgi:hypothetical protein
MPKGHLSLVSLAGLTLVITACSVGLNYKRPEVQRLAKRFSRHRGGRAEPHPSPVEAA